MAAGVLGLNGSCGVGLSLLPTLRHTDLYAEGEDLVLLERDLASILRHVETLAAQCGPDAELIGDHVKNIQSAIRRAREINGGIAIS